MSLTVKTIRFRELVQVWVSFDGERSCPLTRKMPKGRQGVQQETGRETTGDMLNPLPNVPVLGLSSGTLVFLGFLLQPPNPDS